MDEFTKWWYEQHDRDFWSPFEAAKKGREAGMREAGNDAKLLDWLEKKLFAKSWNAVMGSGSRTHWRIAEGHRHITVKMEGETLRDAILSAIGGDK